MTAVEVEWRVPRAFLERNRDTPYPPLVWASGRPDVGTRRVEKEGVDHPGVGPRSLSTCNLQGRDYSTLNDIPQASG